MKEAIFLEPVFKEMIWGGTRLRDDFHYEIPGEHTGECWAISAHQNGDCIVKGGSFKGLRLSTLWKEHRELFGGEAGEVFPLLIKIIDAKADLSIQVHPDDEYARLHENGSLGKTECWYIIDCDPDAKIVIGHHAKDKDELKQMVGEKRWNDLIRVLPVKKGDFFQIEPGTVHAIKAGTLILETQQNSDITYRLYDYDRLSGGKPRELHIDKSIDVIRCPHHDVGSEHALHQEEGGVVERLVSCPYYSVDKVQVDGRLVGRQAGPFRIFSVIDGEGEVDGTKIVKGSHFILPAGYGDYVLSGNMLLISSCPGTRQ